MNLKTRLAPGLIALCLGWAAGTARADSVADARAALARDEPAAAVRVLEAEMTRDAAPSAELISLLKESYQKAADQARAQGRTAQAEEYLENLTILQSARPDTKPASAPEPAPASPPPAAEPAPASPPPTVEAPAAPPAPIPTEPKEEPKAEEVPQTTVRDADKAFLAKEYEQAGKIYAELAAKDKLPANRRDHWGYCRYVAVVNRINANPRTAEEWAEINTEIDRIRELSPKTWVGAYLRKLADERSKGAPSGGKAQPPRVRSATPPSDEAAAERPMSPVPRPAPVPRQPKPGLLDLPRADAETKPAAATDSPSHWQVLESENFRVYHQDAEVAGKVARLAEYVRIHQARRWSGSDPKPWSPRCDIYVFPDAKAYAHTTHQNETSPGFSTLGMNEGAVVQRLVNVRVDHPGMLTSVLPHEITHVVLADFFRDRPIPRWADEGMAVLSEPAEEQERRVRELRTPVKTGRLFKMEDLLRMDYPEGPDWPLYYAQSVSVTRFLVELGSPAQFIDFLQGSGKRGVESELRRVYQIDSLHDLQRIWLQDAREKFAGTAKPATTNPPASSPSFVPTPVLLDGGN